MKTRLLVVVAGLAVVLGVALLRGSPRDSERDGVATVECRHPASPIDDPVAATADFLTSLEPRLLLDPLRRRAFLRRWADPAALASLEQIYAAEADRVRSTWGELPVVARSGLIGYRVVRRDISRIDVAIWAVVLTAGPAGSAASGWSTVTVTLTRRGGGWRVAGVRAAPGPDPDAGAPALFRTAKSFRTFRHAR